MTNKKTPCYIRSERIVEITNVSLLTIKRMIKRGEFPAPTKLHPNSRINVWLEEDIHQWMEEQVNKAR